MKKQLLLLLLFLPLIGCRNAVGTGFLGLRPPSRRESSADAPLHVLTISTADSGGTMSPVGNAIAALINESDNPIKINVSASSGSFDNVNAICKGQSDLALISGDVASTAYLGLQEFEAQPAKKLRAIGAVYSSLSNWMAPVDKKLLYVHDLAGLRLAIGPEDSNTEYSARAALHSVGITDKNNTLINCSLMAGGEAIRSGELDAIHGFAGTPIRALTQLAEAVPCRLLLYTPQELSDILASNSFYYPAEIPAGTYPDQKTAVKTFGIKCLLCVSEDMEEDLVYTLTKSITEAIPQLSQKHPALSVLTEDSFICSELPIPLHEGAKRYYTEAGLLAQP